MTLPPGVNNQQIARQIGKYIFQIMGKNPVKKLKPPCRGTYDKPIGLLALGKLAQLKTRFSGKHLHVDLHVSVRDLPAITAV